VARATSFFFPYVEQYQWQVIFDGPLKESTPAPGSIICPFPCFYIVWNIQKGKWPVQWVVDYLLATTTLC
jgi:hypothetical protein